MRFDFWKKPKGYKCDTLALFDLAPYPVPFWRQTVRNGRPHRTFNHPDPWDAFHWRPGTDTLADDVEREQRITAGIQENPFKHLPPGCRDGWAKDWLSMGLGRCW